MKGGMQDDPDRLSEGNWNTAPELISTEARLDEVLTRPRPVLTDFIRTVSSPLVILGAGGKLGPSLAVLARRAAEAAGHALDIIAVSRFSSSPTRAWLEAKGVKTVGIDLLNQQDLELLPDTENLLYLVGLKFGTSTNPALTWAVNTVVPAHTMRRYPEAKVVALSTGNVYSNVPVQSGGAREGLPLTPLGEYANSAVARERVFEFFARQNGTPLALLRLNYAVELRYGVLVDIARKVHLGDPIDLSNGYLNCIWQGDTNEMVIRALALTSSPPEAWNLTGPMLRVRDLATRFGQLLGKSPRFIGEESDTALLSNSDKLCARLGDPGTSLEAVIRWTAAWVQLGGRSLNKPTHFEARDGQY